MKTSQHYIGLSPWGLYYCNQAAHFTTTFCAFLTLIQVDFDITCLYAQFIEPFEDLRHDRCKDIVPKVIDARAHQLLLGELLQHSKVGPLHLAL